MTAHVDGSSCLEGVQGELPENYIPYCESFDFRTRTCHFDIRFVWNGRNREWGIHCMDGSYIAMLFYPTAATRSATPSHLRSASRWTCR